MTCDCLKMVQDMHRNMQQLLNNANANSNIRSVYISDAFCADGQSVIYPSLVPRQILPAANGGGKGSRSGCSLKG
jgi:hypothetical protein